MAESQTRDRANAVHTAGGHEEAQEEDDLQEDDAFFILQARGGRVEESQMVHKDDQFMQDFLNDQIDEAELCGDEDMLTGLIEEEEQLQFARAENAPSAAELKHEERQLGSHSVAGFKQSAEEVAMQEDKERRMPIQYQTESGPREEELQRDPEESLAHGKVQIQTEKLQGVNKAIFDSSAQLQNILGMNAINRKQ